MGDFIFTFLKSKYKVKYKYGKKKERRCLVYDIKKWK